MKKTLLLSIVCFLVFNCVEVSAKWHCGYSFYVGTADYWESTPGPWVAPIFNIDTFIANNQSVYIQLHYTYYYSELTTMLDSITSYTWKKNGIIVTNDRTYIVTDTGFYEGVFTTNQAGILHAYLHVHYEEATSVNEIKNASSFNLYPNPFTHNFTLDIKTAKASALSYQIYDCTGREIKEVNRENIFGELKLTEDFESMNKGIYFLRMKIGEAEFEKKLVRF
jgi:hypothetical protein